MSADKEPPKRVQKLLNACRGGQIVCLTIRHSEVGDERLYWLEPSGKPAGAWTVEKALELGLLAPCNDGLFGLSQTYRVAQ